MLYDREKKKLMKQEIKTFSNEKVSGHIGLTMVV